MKLRAFGIAALGLVLLGGTVAKAQTIQLLDFDSPEDASDSSNLTNPNGGEGLGAPAVAPGPFTGVSSYGLSTTFGVTQGTHSLAFLGVTSTQKTLFDIGTVGGSTGIPTDPTFNLERFANYNAINNASLASSTAQVNLIFDFTYDATNVTTAGFFQPGIFINSDATAPKTGGFDFVAFGDLAGGNLGPLDQTTGFAGATPFPQPGGASDVQEILLDPNSNSVKGSIEFIVPVGDNTTTAALLLTKGGTSFAQFGVNIQGGYKGTADFAYDNFRFQVVPEPATLGLLSLLAPAFMRRSRR